MGGPNLAGMAWRNLWRNRRRTLLTLSSIAFGTMLAVIFTGMGDSNFSQMIDLAARLGGGHVTLQHPEALDSPNLGRTVSAAPRLAEAALADPEVERVVTRIAGHLMLTAPAQSAGAAFIAFDPAAEDATTLSVLDAVGEGAIFATGEDPGILLGARLASNLDIELGRKVVFTLTDRNGELVQGATRVRGIIRTGAPTVDGGLCLLALGATRRVLGYAPDEAGLLALFLNDQRRADEVAARLERASELAERRGTDSEVVALPWHQIQPDLAGFIGMKVAGARFMEGVILVLVAAGIFNTLFVSVMERLREFGIMLAIGFTPANLFGLVMWESLWLALVGMGLAVAVTAGPYAYLAIVGIDLAEQMGASGSEVAGVAVSMVMRVDIYPENAVAIATAAVLATLVSGVYPAWKAGRVEPVETIRLV